MTGEIEEPLRLNFQADLLHSGSISFGRFESESLSWERRSIFSHNRYLEEVEKYSKPGSVIEKKAYFEAEFKRKALLKRRASECQDGGKSPTTTSRNNDLRDFEESGKFNESSSSFNPSVCNKETQFQHYEEDVEALYSENGNGSTLNSGYDEDISQECESQNCEFLPVSTQDDPVMNMADCPVSVLEQLKFDETHQSETEDVMGITEQSIGATPIEKVVLLDVASKAKDSSLACQTPKKDDVTTSFGSRIMSSSKVKPASEKKLTRATPKTQANVGRFQKHGSYEVSKGSMKPKTTESKFLPIKRTENKSPRPASPFSTSGIKTSKAEDAKSLKEKELRLKKSVMKDLTSEKTAKAQFPLLEKSLPGVRSTVNRPKQTISSSKAHVVQSAAGFSLNTDQRVENRKEFFFNIAEKTHAKDVKVNQVETKTLEKQAAQMKQFRRSLNFKATPVPSFFSESSRGSDRHKVTPISKTLNQPRPSSQSMATRCDKNALNSCVPSNIRPCSSTASTNMIRFSDSVRRNNIPEKKEQEKKNDTCLTKQKEPKPRLVKKQGKCIHTGGSPKLGRLAAN